MSPEDTLILPLLDNRGKKVATLELVGERAGTLHRQPDAEAALWGEETTLLQENSTYQYRLQADDVSHRIRLKTGIIPVTIGERAGTEGRIETGSRAGGMAIELENGAGGLVGVLRLEVRTTKIDYRQEYRAMLGAITDRCTDLLLDLKSPVSLQMIPDPARDPQTLAQRFVFLKSLLSGSLLRDSIRQIVAAPHSRLVSEIEDRNIRKGFPAGSDIGRQIASRHPRINLPATHPMAKRFAGRGLNLNSVPSQISIGRNVESTDTAENRFIKHALEIFSATLGKIETALKEGNPLLKEVTALRAELDGYLMHSFFREISAPDHLPLGSTVLQRKAGYREVLSVWLKFNMAARLFWPGGNEVFGEDDRYGGSNRDMGKLYEYWLFFVLLDQAEKHFDTGTIATAELLKKTPDGFGLTLKSGRNARINGRVRRENRVLNVRFDYNRTFACSDSPDKTGTWTREMRPDFTFTFWPEGWSEADAEAADLLVHVHFDSKYRAETLKDVFGNETDDEVDTRKIKPEVRGKTYKREDLLVVHTYRDAIRRTAGAYILYPGNDEQRIYHQFHEILPGLGAFAVRPTKDGATGIDAVSRFLDDVIDHVCDRATRREQMTFHTHRIRTAGPSSPFTIALPEKLANRRPLPPAESGVVVIRLNADTQELLDQGQVFLEVATNSDLKALLGATYLLTITPLNVTPEAASFYRVDRGEISPQSPDSGFLTQQGAQEATGVFLRLVVVPAEGEWPAFDRVDPTLLPDAATFVVSTMAALFSEK